MRILILGLAFALVLCSGCDNKAPIQIPEYVADHRLPHGAVNLQDRGNGWWTFELVIDGKSRKFLWGNGDKAGYFTELSDEKN